MTDSWNPYDGQNREAEHVSTTPRVLGGRYEVGELIGRGGMADVHLGHDTRLGRTVAIKILRSDLARDAGFLMRFRREAQSAAGLNHPSIVAIFDSGEDDTMVEGPGGVPTTLPYMVMEHVDGRTLRQILTERRQLDPVDAIRFTQGVLEALAYSHRMGIVHRDIKPANVMLTAQGHVKVMDFGIARAIADTAATMTQTSSVVGTAQYLSPEQAQGQTVDARSDLYSTGCMLFELLTGRPPFTGDSPVAIAYQHVGEAPQPPSTWNTSVGGDLDAVTLHALAKDREARYQDAAAFRNDLENVRLGRPISEAARGTAVMAGAAATQTMPAPYAAAGTPTAVQPQLTSRRQRYENTAGLPSVGYDETDGGRPRNSTGRAVGITILVIALLAAVAFGAIKMFSNNEPPVTMVSVPKITEIKDTAAERVLTGLNLKFKRVEAANDADPGIVVAQDPAEGASVPEGTVVTYTVSTGPGEVEVPDVKGKSVEEAEAAIKEAGLTVGKTLDENSAKHDEDEVIRTMPGAGELLKKGDPVDIVRATGKVEVPADQEGRTWVLVAQALNAAGLNPVQEEVETDKEAPDTVLEVEKAGQVVAKGTTITVKVAKAPTTPVPPPTTTTTTPTGTETPPPTGTETPPVILP